MISTILPAYKYLIEQRGLTEETILTFNLGYVSDIGDVYIGAGFDDTLPPLDKRFYHSSLFPIFDLYGKCIAASVRPLGPTKTKYINTEFEKKEHLYGLSVTWPACLKAQAVYVVEGNISLLQMYQAGVTNCVAMLGSRLSPTQVCLLNRFVKKIVMVPDADKAGRRLIEKMNDEIIPTKLYDSDVKFTHVELPEGNDPDDYMRSHAKEQFLGLKEEELTR
jgi:DNA primase